MIKGVHTMFYTSERRPSRVHPRQARFPWTDVGEGWLIFDLPEATWLPPADAREASTRARTTFLLLRRHPRDVEELRGRGVEFVGEIVDAGYGWSRTSGCRAT